MVASRNASPSDWFINCESTTYFNSCRSMFITLTEYTANTKQVKGYIAVTLFASGVGSAWLISQLPYAKMEMIILQEVTHLPGSFNIISQSQFRDKDVKVVPVNHFGFSLNNHHGKLITTALLVDWLFALDGVLDQE